MIYWLSWVSKNRSRRRADKPAVLQTAAAWRSRSAGAFPFCLPEPPVHQQSITVAHWREACQVGLAVGYNIGPAGALRLSQRKTRRLSFANFAAPFRVPML